MNMNSLHILPTIMGGGVSTIYKAKQHMQIQEANKPLLLNPPKLLPHWQQLPKWEKGFRRPI
jgi:hypothetical protein